MNQINAEVKLNKNKCTDKAYFDKMYKKFSFEMQKTFVLEELRLKSRYVKPSQYKKLKAQSLRNKWKYLK